MEREESWEGGRVSGAVLRWVAGLDAGCGEQGRFVGGVGFGWGGGR